MFKKKHIIKIKKRHQDIPFFYTLISILCGVLLLQTVLPINLPGCLNKIILSLLLTYAISSGFLAWLVGWQYIWTNKSKEQLMDQLKKQKSLQWYFELNQEKQWWIKIVVIGLLFLLCYMVISSEVWYWICYQILQLIGRKSFSADDQQSKKAAPSSQQEQGASNSAQDGESKPRGKPHGSSNKPQPSSSEKDSKAAGSSSKPQPSPSQKDSKETRSSTKGKASTSAKKNRSSAKATPSDSNKASQQSSKKDSKATLQQLMACNDPTEDEKLIADLKKKAQLQEKPLANQTFTALQYEKGGDKNKVTKMERGDTSKEVYKDFDALPGNTAEDFGKYFGSINKSDPIFDE